ncbi:hypothetical protein PRIPAC_88711 [Pristionchus pacificus]|uniref:NADAR domain-containing protein n=1 Tax=Pristionchus pacificus TaxID=54126 RepID=A0A2A6B5V7_PRIPA|nr:hypothetical protein PRIPAC_88711 [Pristionchus pacificus]|eukprot:PDM61241.1 hypothetical protein PRIPAC_50683 [Pristionchus pacificus]
MERVSRCDLLCPYGHPGNTLRIQAMINQLPSQSFAQTQTVHPLNAITYLNSTLGMSFVCFQGSRSVLGNCFRAPFPLDNQVWPSVQHYFHHFKAVMFGDHESALTIRSATSSTVAKQLGRRVKNFDHVQWELVSTEVMTRAVYHKFVHDTACRASLLSTNDSVIVECGLFNQESADPRSWRSENKLGKILTLVRDHLRR